MPIGSDPGAVGVDWVAWHAEYDRPGSSMRHRLRVVQAYLRRSLTARAPGPIPLVAACAGQGRDVIEVLRTHPRRADVRARLVELDPVNAAAARAAAGTAGVAHLVEVVTGDAGVASAYAGAVPAGVVMMCGVFGNLTDDDVRRTVAALPQLCAPGAYVIWTRHREPPDLTPAVRRWFAEAGFEEVAFHAPADRHVGVGRHRLTAAPRPFQPDRRYFTFAR